MDDERYLKLLYRGVLGRPLQLDPPVLYSEKLQWLKLHDKNPMYPILCDKLAVRNFVRERGGEAYLNDLYGIWDSPDQIDFSILPDQFALKCAHDSGSAIICWDKATFDVNAACKTLKKKLRRDYSVPGREWPYRDVPRRVLAERYLVNTDGSQAMDYKFFCFDGKAQLVLVCTNHIDRHSGNYTYLRDFTQYQIYQSDNPEPEESEIPKPPHYEEMVAFAERLSEGLVHIRVDLYDTPEGIKFGELTQYSSSGLSQTMTLSGEQFLGGLLRLENVK
ncbi:MAG: glycosyl transferase [Clostridiales bacterium]|nr:glycosyl transferase [Clostridiales bacterium]